MQTALITPSYGPDFERCRLLCQTVEQHVTGDFEHHLIVDARDEAQFRKLAGPRTRVVTVESVIPWWLRRLPGTRRWWFNARGLPVRNWILQQLVKLSVAEFLSAEAYCFVDSDVSFIRPFDVKDLEQDGRLRLFRVPGAANLPGHRRWHRTAASLLGLPPTDYFGSTYIGNLITWRHDHLKLMYRRIEAVSGRPWLQAVCRRWHLSEYILYGVFVEHALGPYGRQAFTDVPLCHISWDYQIETDADIERFFQAVQPQHVAVMMSAKQTIEPDRYRHLIESPSLAVTG